MTETEYDEIVEKCFQRLYEKSLKSDRFAGMPEAEKATLLAEARERNRKMFDKTRLAIEERNVSLTHGILLPNNPCSRMLFTAITGITLPKGVNATRQAVRDYIGPDNLAIEAGRLQKIADDEAAKKKAIADARILEIKRKIYNDVEVEAEQLIDVVRDLKIDAHPRTIGTIRTRLVTIKEGQARVYSTIRGKKQGPLPQAVFNLFTVVQEALLHRSVWELIKLDGSVAERMINAHRSEVDRAIADDAMIAAHGPLTARVVFDHEPAAGDDITPELVHLFGGK